MYKAQISRGTNGFGFVEIWKKEVCNFTRTVTEDEIFEMIDDSKATEIMFHHRIPTSTENVPESNHPIPVQHESLEFDYIGVHNGMIYNAEELKKRYEKLGFEYTTTTEEVIRTKKGKTYSKGKAKFNDSESLLIDVARAIEDPKKKILDSSGSIAFMILQIEKKTNTPVKLFYGRNNQKPLVMQSNKNLLSISSEGSGDEIEAHKLWYLDYKTGKFEEDRELIVGQRDAPKPVKVVTTYTGGDWHEYSTHNKQLCEKCRNKRVPNWIKDKSATANQTAIHDIYNGYDDVESTMGFKTNHKNNRHIVNLPFKQLLSSVKPKEEDTDPLAEDTGIMWKPYAFFTGLEDTGLQVKLFLSEKVFFYRGDLEKAWIETLNELDFYKDVLKLAQESGEDAHDVKFYIENAVFNADALEKQMKIWCPERFKNKEVTHAVKQTELPIINA